MNAWTEETLREKEAETVLFHLAIAPPSESNKLIAIIEELLWYYISSGGGRKSVAGSPWRIGPAPSGPEENRRIKYPACFHGTLP